MAASAKKRGNNKGRAAVRTPLSRERITIAALRLIDEIGLDRFSTRELGKALGCEAMAIYRHFPSKDALLDSVVGEMTTKISVPAADAGDWASRARAFARSYRALSRIHPNAFPLMATRRFNTPATLALLDRVFASYLADGFDALAIAQLYRTLGNFATGSALQGLADAAYLARLSAADQSITDLSGLPALAAVSEYFGPAHADAIFERGLDLIVAGSERLRKARD